MRRSVTVWVSEAEWAALDGFAREAGVETGALVREAALSGAAGVGREVRAGRLRLRRRRRRAEEPASVEVAVAEREVGVPASGVARADAFRRMTGS